MIFYQNFLLRQELISRGDFVDVDNLECTPKIGKYTVSNGGNLVVLYSVLAQFTMMTIITKIMTTMKMTILSTMMMRSF